MHADPEHAREQDVLLRIAGTVQGVGFRPFAARLAARAGLRGWVRNDDRGVTLRASGPAAAVAAFRAALAAEAPPAARLATVEAGGPAPDDPPLPETGFAILDSPPAGTAPDAAVAPDLALCAECRRELLDPGDRRHHYPFITCTHCGPRYSIVRALPYDRARTTMAGFAMCPACAREYADPADRRFHAQPDACPVCGPGIAFLDAAGHPRAAREDAMEAAVALLRAGKIAAVKGLGGFHLFVDARDEPAVRELRRRKHREEKPLAVMFSSLEALALEAVVDERQAALLQSPAAPIVLVRRRPSSTLAAAVAPGNPWIGALLAYTPVHVLLAQAFGGPLVATSANPSEEPLCTGNDEAVGRLHGIADGFLVHNRPIARPVDDSVVRFSAAGPIVLRRARGWAPAPLLLPEGSPPLPPTLCAGGHLKNTIAVTAGAQIVLGPHIGDLGNPASIAAFRRTVELLGDLYGGRFEQAACDAHPDYASTVFAGGLGLPVVPVQHHVAHVLACMLEHGGGPNRVLGVAWDGTGYGDDGAIWGGEFILVDRGAGAARRVAHLRPFRLPGGEAAVREPRRAALGAVHAADAMPPGDSTALAARLGFRDTEAALLLQALARGINSPSTTSAGRLFDAVAALLGIARRNPFEGWAAMALEFAADRATGSAPHAGGGSMVLRAPAASGDPWVLDWAPTLAALAEARTRGAAVEDLALRFHEALARGIAAVAREVAADAVALTGGCFQNAHLTDLAAGALRAGGHRVLLHHQLPPNDNSIAAGQALAVSWGITRTTPRPSSRC
jgi:hydrogenase maturation protein HypF